MPQNIFNASFMSPPEQDKITDYSVLYGEAPLYFTPTSGTALKEQLENFRKTSNFSFLQHQYETLLDNLKTWCDRHECGIFLNNALTDDEESSPAFALLKNHLFATNHYFEKGEATFFNDGKMNLEELWLLLENERIPLDGKLKVLRELQTGLNVCADGIQTNIRNATNELKAHLGINESLQQIKTEFIQQHALSTIQSLFGDRKNYAGFEIHYVNAYYNYVAKDFGLSERDDSYISAAKRAITPFNQLHFTRMLWEQFTPHAMLGLLLVKLRGDWSALHTELSEKLKQLRTNWSTITNPELIQIMGQNTLFSQEKILFTNVLEQWNQKYGTLITLNFYDLSEVDDNGVIVLHDLPTLTKLLEPQIIKKFSEQYLEPGSQFRLKIEPNLTLCAHHGLLWCERQQIPEVITLEHVKKINPERLSLEEQVHYCFVLNQLFEQLPEEQVELSRIVHSLDEPLHDLIWEQGLIHCILHLDFKQQGSLLSRYAQENQPGAQKLITRYPDKLLNHLWALHLDPKQDRSFESLFNIHCHYKGIEETTLLGYAVHAQHWDFIAALVQSSCFLEEYSLAKINYKTLREVNLLWIIVAKQRWELLDKLISHNLVTETQLAFRPLNEERNLKGANVLHLLSKYQQWDAIKKLLLCGCITAELLESTSLAKLPQRTNLMLLLAKNEKWDLINIIVQRNLITKTSFQFIAYERFKGENDSFMTLLMKHQQWDLMNLLVQQHNEVEFLVIGAIFARSHNSPGMTMLGWLANYRQWYLLEKKFNQEGLTTADLLAPTSFAGVTGENNLVSLLAKNEKWDLINILVQRNLITSSLLAASPMDNPQGLTVLHQLAYHKQWNTLELLFNQEGLITAELLESTSLAGLPRRTNLILLLAKNEKWDLINIIVQRNLITNTLLHFIAHFGLKVENDNFMTLLIKHQQWDLINLLVQQHNEVEFLVIGTIFARSHNSPGMTVLGWLANYRQWYLLEKKFNQEELTTVDLLAPTSFAGVTGENNLVSLLAKNEKWDLINILVQRNLITSELLAPRTQGGENQRPDVLTLLINAQQWALIGTLLQQNLLTAEQQLLIPEESNLLSTNTQYTPAFFNVFKNNDMKRKTMDKQDECSDESNLKKRKP